MNNYKSYLVKSDTQVGVFAAQDTNELFWLVDRHTNPYRCKWAESERGEGVMVDYTVIPEDEVFDFALSEGHELLEAVDTQKVYEWHSFTEEDSKPPE